MSAKFRKIAVWIMTFIIIACIAGAIPALVLNSGVSYALSGEGTQEAPFTISSINDLKAFRDDVNNGNSYSGKYVTLTTDLDLQSKTFEPIGNHLNKAFSGIFDGNGHTIKNLFIKRTVSDILANNVGFFGVVTNGTVKNITFDGGYIYSNSSNGSAATTSKKSGSAIASLSGGVVGLALNSTVSNAHFVGQINAIGGNGGAGSTKSSFAVGGNGGNGYAGGVVAQSDSSVIEDCSFVGMVYSWGGTGGQGGAATDGAAGAGGNGGHSYTGGIVAYAYASEGSAPTQISRCYSNYYMLARTGSGGAGGNAASNTTYAGGAGGAGSTIKSGGVVGRMIDATLDNCFAVGQVDLYSAVNGIPGNYGSSSKNNVALKTTRSLQSIGGVVGSAESATATITNVYAQTNIEEAYLSHGISDVNTHMGGIVGTVTVAGVKIKNAVTIASSMTAEKGIYNLNGQNIKAAKGATMSPVATFETDAVAASVNSLAENIIYVEPEYTNRNTTSPKPTFNLVSAEVTKLTNANWSDEGWWKDDSVWEINPAYNGGNPVLKGVPFKVYPKRTIEIDSYDKLYEIASRIATGEVFLDLTLNINADIDLGSSEWITLGTDFYHAPFKLTINGNNHNIKNMRISRTSAYKGFIGYGRVVIINDLTIEDPQITGAGGDYTGGLIGYAQYYAKLNNCHVSMGNKPSSLNSKIIGRTYTGGLAGYIVGNGHRSEVINCSSNVNVRCATGAGTSANVHTGGLIGAVQWTRVENCYATGNVTCDSYSTQTYFAGGLIGTIVVTSQIVNCFATGNVAVGSEGSFIGYVHQQARGTQISNCYFTGNVTYSFNNINSSTFIRYGGLVARNVGLNVGFYNNVALTQHVTFASNTSKASYRRLGSLVSAAAPAKSLAATPANSNNTAATSEWANCYQASTRITPVYQNNHMIKTDWKANNVAIAHNSGTTNNYFINEQASTVTVHSAMSQMQTQSFWENTMHYDFTKDWEFNSYTKTPTLKDNPYKQPGLGDDIIEIATKEELGILRDVVNAGNSLAGRKVKLTADIDLSGVNWKPIGVYSDTASANRYFQGSFDGDGRTIKNLYVNQTAAYKGLFGYAASGSEIKNITFTNPVIERNGYKYTGVVAAYLVDGTIENCHVVGGRVSSTENFVAGIVGIVDGKSVGATNIKNCSVTYATDAADNYSNQISGASYVGAIAGITRGTVEGGVTISDCYSNYNVTSTNVYLGGIVGYACGTNILRCYSTGSVSAETTGFAGGIVGSVGNAYIGTPLYSAVTNITDCFTTGDVRSYAEADAVSIAGGIAGRVNGAGAVISNCIVYGDIGTNNLSTSSDKKVSSAGGIIGLGEVANIKISGCVVLSENILSSNMTSGAPAYSSYYGTGTVSGSPSANKSNLHLQDCYLSPVIVGTGNAGNVKNSLGTARTAEAFKNASLYSGELGWDTDVWAVESGVNNGYPYLKALGAPVYEKGSRFNPIEINNKEEFAAFNANVNNGFVYPGLYLRQTNDLDLTGIGRTGYSKTRYFGGHYDGENHKLNNFSLSSTANVLGLFGYTRGATISNLTLVKPYLKQTGTSANNVGPLVGYSRSNLLIENCAVIGGTVNTQGYNAGGLVGCLDQGFNRVIKSFSTATVTGGYRVGGLAGYLLAGQMEQCYYTGAVTAVHTGNFPAGGLVGSLSYGSKISNCYAKADVKDTSTTVTAEAGGLVGNILSDNQIIENCYFYGTLKASSAGSTSGTRGAYAAGIVAYSAYANVRINNCAVLATDITASGSSVGIVQAAHIAGTTGTQTAGTLPVATNCIRLDTVVCSGKKGNYTPVNCNVTATMDEFASEDPTVNKFRTTLNWNFNDVWVTVPNLNDGLPMLLGLPVDNSDIDTVIVNAETYLAEDWSSETFAVLTAALEAAKADIENITPEQKAEHIAAIEAAIEGLRPNLEALQELYDGIEEEKVPYKEWFVSFTTMDAALAQAEIILNANSNKYKNRDVINALAALMLADTNLVVNKTRLNEAITKANSVFEVDYQPAEWKNLQDEKLVAVSVNNNSAATAFEVMTATEALEAAIEGLKIDKSKLEEKIRSAYEAIGATVTFEDGEVTVDDTDALAPEKFVNFTSFKDVLDDAVEIYLQDDALATTVSQIAYDLNVALNNLAIDRSGLRDLYNKASMEQESHYTDESWADFTEAYEEAGTVLYKPAPTPAGLIDFSAEVDEACEKLKQALNALEVDKSVLEELIKQAEAEEENEEIYSPESWAALSNALEEAREVCDDTDATSAQINAAAVKLNQAIRNLTVNISFLKEKIAEAEKYIAARDKGYYTDESMDALEDATDAAQTCVDLFETTTEDVEIEEVKQITADLLAAIDALAANVEKLQGYIDGVTDEEDPWYSVEKGYAKDSVDELLQLADEAEELLAGDYTDEEVIKAIKDFDSAFESMKADKTELAALVKEVSGWSNVKYRQDNNGDWILDEETGELKVFVVYSEESWNDMQAELALAEGILNKADATLSEVKAATENLKAAVDALVIDTSELEMRIEKAEELLTETTLYTEETLAALATAKQAACDVVEGVAELQIEDVQYALDTLVSAINNLEIDTTELMRIYGIAEGQLENEIYYTADSFSGLAARVNFIGGILGSDPDLTADEVTEFIRQLDEVLDGLQVDLTEYEELSAAVDGLCEIVITDATYAAVAAAYGSASAIVDDGLLESEDYGEKFDALEEFKVKLSELAEAINNVQPDLNKYKQFIADNEALTTQKYVKLSIDELTEVIAAAKIIANDAEQFTYDNVVQNVNAILDVVDRMIPDTAELEELVSDTIGNLETLHTVTETIDENGDITVIDDPLYIGIDMYTYEYYTAVSYQRLLDVITAAQAVIANPASYTLENVNDAYNAILDEINNLQVNPTLLEELIASCGDVNKDYYVADTVSALDDALDSATAAADNPAVTLQKYTSEYNKLAAAYAGLKFNTDTLDRLIALAQAIITDNANGTKYYSVNSITDLTDALDEATAFDPDVELADEESAVSYEYLCASLSDAIDGVVDITDLHDAIEAAKQFVTENPNEGQWTVESYKTLTDAINTAENVFNDDAVTAEEAAAQVERIKDPESFLENVEPVVTVETFQTVEGNTTFAFINAGGEELDAETREYDADNPTYLINLALGDSLADICAQFTNTTVRAFKADGETEITDLTAVIATGMILRSYVGGEMTDEITLVIRGDVNGDGKVSTADRTKLNAYLSGKTDLEGAYLLACNVNGDSKVSTADRTKLNAYISGKAELYEDLSVKREGD